jgi:hypothetical protein
VIGRQPAIVVGGVDRPEIADLTPLDVGDDDDVARGQGMS